MYFVVVFILFMIVIIGILGVSVKIKCIITLYFTRSSEIAAFLCISIYNPDISGCVTISSKMIQFICRYVIMCMS